MINHTTLNSKEFLLFATGTKNITEVTTALPLTSNLTSPTKSSVPTRNYTQVVPTLSYETRASSSSSGEESIGLIYLKGSSTTSQPPVQISTQGLSKSTPTVMTTRSSSPSDEPFVNQPWASPSVGRSPLDPVHYNKTKERNPATKESPVEVPQGKQKDVFIRRKHKEPYYKSDEKIRPSNSPLVVFTRVKSSELHKANESIFNKSASSSKRGRNQSRNSTKNRTFTTSRRSKNVESHSTTLTTTKKPKSARKRPINMGIPASSTVLLLSRTTSTIAPTPEVYNNPDSDEYYASYDEYSGVVSYNSSGRKKHR